jgi:hypothetical protein
MWSEEMDKKIKAAAEKSVHQYQDKNWRDMELLLDKHLPEDKRRRRILFIVLASLIGLGLGGYFFFNRDMPGKPPVKDQSTVSAASKNNTRDNLISSPSPSQTQESGSVTNAITLPGVENNPNAPAKSVTSKIPAAEIISQAPISISPVKTTDLQSMAPANNADINPVNSTKQVPLASEKGKNDWTVNVPASTNAPSTSIDSKSSQPATTFPILPTIDSTSKATDVAKEEKKQVDSTATAVKKPKAGASNKFSINLLLAPDVSSAGIDNPGRITMQYGVGISYELSQNWHIRTGLLAGQKIYSADSTSYKTQYTSGIYNSKLEKIDANCFVYEIPVSVVYHFNGTKKHNWFVSVGASSYLMHKETYKYIYKTQSGPVHSYVRSYSNENTHLFSVLSLSGGYRYQVNKKVSILAEPYFKTPLGGIGAGRVKLNSAGVMITGSFNPFKK